MAEATAYWCWCNILFLGGTEKKQRSQNPHVTHQLVSISSYFLEMIGWGGLNAWAWEWGAGEAGRGPQARGGPHDVTGTVTAASPMVSPPASLPRDTLLLPDTLVIEEK